MMKPATQRFFIKQTGKFIYYKTIFINKPNLFITWMYIYKSNLFITWISVYNIFII